MASLAANAFDREAPGYDEGFGRNPVGLLFRYVVVRTVRSGAPAPAKPWDGADGLEWMVPSPAPYHTFETPPVVK